MHINQIISKHRKTPKSKQIRNKETIKRAKFQTPNKKQNNLPNISHLPDALDLPDDEPPVVFLSTAKTNKMEIMVSSINTTSSVSAAKNDSDDAA